MALFVVSVDKRLTPNLEEFQQKRFIIYLKYNKLLKGNTKNIINKKEKTVDVGFSLQSKSKGFVYKLN